MVAPRPVLPALLAIAVATACAGCGSGAPTPAEPTPPEPAGPSVELDAPPPIDETAEAPPPEPPPSGAVASSGSTEEPDPNAKFREITPRECQALGGKYGELTRSDETAKLNPKLTAAQRAQAIQSIEAAARTLEGRWVESCSSSLLGKVAEEAAITCAMSAKNVAEFDTCLNGPK